MLYWKEERDLVCICLGDYMFIAAKARGTGEALTKPTRRRFADPSGCGEMMVN